jgi:hypothetical protein
LSYTPVRFALLLQVVSDEATLGVLALLGADERAAVEALDAPHSSNGQGAALPIAVAL